MSELIDNGSSRRERIYQYLTVLVEGHASKEQYLAYKPIIDTITGREVIFAVDCIMKSGTDIDAIKAGVNKFVTGTSSTLLSYPIPGYPVQSVLSVLSTENAEIRKRMEACKERIQGLNKDTENRDDNSREIRIRLEDMETFSHHYTKLQNVLFPAVEAMWPDFRCTQLMWSYHDDIMRTRKHLIEILSRDDIDLGEFNTKIGRFYFDVYAMIFREEHILFPEIHRQFPADSLRKLYADCFDIGFAYIDPPRPSKAGAGKTDDAVFGSVPLETGTLSPEQLVLMLNNLPCDVTYVNAEDEVAYFSSPEDRNFPRSPSIIGRKVQNCHPPESVHVVQEIIDSFRDGTESTAEFWINVGVRKIHIRYFALRDGAGVYMGTLEVSQDITGIQALTGEKRLLDHK